MLPAMFQQVYPTRRKLSPKRYDGNLNLLDATAVAFHVSMWSLWSQAPPSKRAIWKPLLHRFKGNNAAPDVMLGGLVENITIDKYADPRGNTLPRRWCKRTAWRNKAYLADRVEFPTLIPLLFPTWMWLAGPQHTQWRVRIRAWKSYLGLSSVQQQFVQTQAAATTSFPLGNVHYTGGRIVVT